MFFGEEKDLDHIQRVRAHIRSHLKAMLGLEDTSGVEVHALVRALARLCEFVESQRPGSPELSGPRWGLFSPPCIYCGPTSAYFSEALRRKKTALCLMGTCVSAGYCS